MRDDGVVPPHARQEDEDTRPYPVNSWSPIRRYLTDHWGAIVERMWWMATHYWKPTIIAVGVLVADALGAVTPGGTGYSLFLGWFMTVALVSQKAVIEAESEGGE